MNDAELHGQCKETMGAGEGVGCGLVEDRQFARELATSTGKGRLIVATTVGRLFAEVLAAVKGNAKRLSVLILNVWNSAPSLPLKHSDPGTTSTVVLVHGATGGSG